MDLQEHLLVRLRDLGVQPGDLLGLAVSGGADSTALLHLGAEVCGPEGIDLHVLHVDHGLRHDSAQDARFVEAAAASHELPCTVLRSPVHPMHGESVEAVARRIRYEALEGAASRLGCRFVATAHTLDDQAETVLLRVVRGTGVGALAGVRPRRGPFIRPLLGVRRADLGVWLEGRDLSWVDDPTNTDQRFERNWVRVAVLPVLAERRPGVAKALARLAELARADEAFLDAQATEAFDRVAVVGSAEILVGAEALARLPEALARRVVRTAMRMLGTDPDAGSVADVRALLDAPTGSLVVRTPSVIVSRTDDGVLFVRGGATSLEPVTLPAKGSMEAPQWGVRVRVDSRSGSVDTWSLSLPADHGPLQLRRRLPGDRVRTPGGTRKVQDVLVDAKVPRVLRDRVPVLATSTQAVAVVGLTVPPVPSGFGNGGDAGSRRTVIGVEPLEGSWWEVLDRWTRLKRPANS